MTRNERLVAAMQTAGIGPADLARRAEVNDPKTIQRWVTGRQRPHRRTAELVGVALGVPVSVLWPDLGVGSAFPTELVHMYATRRELQPAYVEALARGAHANIDVLAYAATWLWDSVPDVTNQLAQAARRACTVRICLGDPASPAVAARGVEEGIGEAMSARCTLAISYAAPLVREFPEVLRLHATTLYASMFRFDDDLLVNWHVYGTAAADAPVFHFRLTPEADTVASRLTSAFDAVWASSAA